MGRKTRNGGGRRGLGSRPITLVIAALTLVASWASSSSTALAASPAGAYIGPAGASGSVLLDRGGTWREAELATSAFDAHVRFNVATDKVADGRGQTVVIVARRTARQSEYRLRLRFTADGGVSAAVIRLVRGARSVIRSEQRLSGITRRPGTVVAVRMRISGVRPTTIRLRAWLAGTREPARWSDVVTDSRAELAGPGWLGMRFGVTTSTVNLPVRFEYDAVQVSLSDPVPAPPDPPPTSSPVASPSGPPSPTATAAATPTSVPSPAPSATPSPTTTPAPSATPTSDPVQLPPNSYFVSPTGADWSPGTRAAPWLTLQKAADSVPAGGTVLIRSGSYAGFAMTRSGSASAPITFAAYPGEQPIVDGRSAISFTIRLNEVRHVRLVGLAVIGGYAPGQDGGGIQVSNSANVEISDSVLRDNKSFGIRSSNSTNVVIDGNEITGNANGVRISGAGEGTRVTNNLIHDNNQMMVNTPGIANDDVGAEGVSLVRSTGNVLVSSNYLWGNRARSYDYTWDGGAFSIYAASNWTITNNITWDNENILETGTDAAKTPCAGNAFTRNLNYAATTAGRTYGMVLRCASDTLIANNTFAGIQEFVFALSHNKGSWGASIDGLRILNNIVSISTGEIFRIESALPVSIVIDNDLVRVTGDGVVASGVPGVGRTTSMTIFSSRTGYEAHGTQADPRFMDATANDYRLRSDSPAIDAGRILPGVTDGYWAAGPDIGYVERR